MATGFVFADDIREQERFLEILHHTQLNGNVIRLTLGTEDNPEPKHFANRDLKKVMYVHDQKNAYISLNTFKSYRRLSSDVWNYSGIYLDLDGHEIPKDSLEDAIAKTEAVLESAYKNKVALRPTMITRTGRGLGVFYIFKSSIANVERSKKSIDFMEDVQRMLFRKYKEILKVDGTLDVDSSVSDPARVVRLPGTWNMKAGKMCHLAYVNEQDGEVAYYTLGEIVEGCHLDKYFKAREKARAEIRKNKVISIDAYRLPFLTIRMQKLELLQELRAYDCKGAREYMCFIYYNAAKQVYPYYQAVEKLEHFNQAFNDPISQSEIDNIIAGTDRNKPSWGAYEGFYKLPDDFIIENLNVTPDENKVCHFGATKRQIERAQAKENNQAKKQKRNDEIASFIVEHSDETYQDIAMHFGVSESTVRRIAKDNNIRRYKVIDGGCDESKKIENRSNVQKLSQSSYVVFFAGLEQYAPDNINLVEVDSGTPGETIADAYVKLYEPVTKRRRKNKQIKGQLGFVFDKYGKILYNLYRT